MSEKKRFNFLLFTLVALLLSACAGSAAAEEAEDAYATIPEQLTSELQVQVAYNDTDIVGACLGRRKILAFTMITWSIPMENGSARAIAGVALIRSACGRIGF
jgi:hypothetical protein